MASFPSSQTAGQAQRPSSPHQDFPSSTSYADGHEEALPLSTPESEPSKEPQTRRLETPSSSPISSTISQQPEQSQQPSSDDEPRKCWICFADETEDTPTSSAWRSPCPCALTAHESCLLDWVADLEAPKSQRRTGSPPKIQCPQCKKDIIIARPRSLVVSSVNTAERVASRLVLPGLFGTLAGSLVAGTYVHGFTSVYLIFGGEDFKRLMGVGSPHGVSTRWVFGLPMIPLVLVLARTTIADSILPVLPILFFVTSDSHGAQVDLWPPSAAMTVAMLPYLRGLYNELYRRLFAEREQRWMKQVLPRAGDNAEETVQNHEHVLHENPGGAAVLDEANGNIEFELNLQVEIIGDEANDMEQPGPEQAMQRGGDLGNANVAPNLAPAPRANNNFIVSTNRIADTVIGALCFPAIASVMGLLLRGSLPERWVIYTDGPRKPGLLQTRWGRSILGGCLFVVMKDTLLLYSKYRVAQDHRKRTVLDFDRSRNKRNSEK
jgi:hypothetical protein